MSLSHEDVHRLLQLLDTSHFDELHLETDGTKIMLRRRGAGTPKAEMLPAMTPVAAERPAPVPAAVAPASTPPSANSEPNSAMQEKVLRAEMLGTFYGAPKPGAAPFVAVGTVVEPTTVIGIIEVMKLMNSIAAGVHGEVIEVLVRDGELVEYDQPLMRVRAL